MSRCFLVCFFALCAFSVSAGHGGVGGKGGAAGYMGKQGSDGGNGADGGSASNTPGRPGCPGGKAHDFAGKFHIPQTKKECNPGSQDSMKKHQPMVVGV